jgi:hypothetical protein|tara:strand:+ start:7789 stop:7908 length:120 start_codon:yes stop_codon:yes gene_type:complete
MYSGSLPGRDPQYTHTDFCFIKVILAIECAEEMQLHFDP